MSKSDSGLVGKYIKLLPYLALLSTRSIPALISFKLRAKKAGKIFEKELLDCGMDKEMAQAMKEDYMKASKLSSFFKGFNMGM